MTENQNCTLTLLDYGRSIEDNTNVLSLDELFSLPITGIIRTHFFRYSRVKLITYDIGLLRRPFNKALMIYAMGCGKAAIIDTKGGSIQLSICLLFWWGARALFERFTGAFYVRILMPRVISRLSGSTYSFTQMRKDSMPLYLRTDLIFGLTAGGSIAHISGVANCLHDYYGRVDFFTTDLIPSVSSDIHQHIIDVDRKYGDSPSIKEVLYSLYIADFVRQNLTNRTPIFIYQRYSLSNFSGAMLAEKFRCPFVLEYNGSEVWIAKNWGANNKQNSFAEKIENLNLKRADLIVTVSEALKDTLISAGVQESKILVNPNGVDSDLYSPNVDGSMVRQKYSIENSYVFGFIGTFGDWHGVLVLIQAFHIVVDAIPSGRENLRLLMVGDGKLMPDVEKYIIENRLSDCCILTGTVPQSEGAKYLSACDVLVSPHVPNSDGSRFFGSPTKLFEYMAMGKTIIASELDQIGEILDDSVAVLVPPGDVEQLSISMQRCYENPGAYSSLGKYARERVKERYTWKAHTDKIIKRVELIES